MTKYKPLFIVGVLSALLALLHSPAIGASDKDDAELRRTPIVRAVERAAPAVVNISAQKRVTVRDPFFDLFEREDTVDSIGSGVIFHPDGYVVTNSHVVAGTSQVTVRLADKRNLDAAVLVVDQVSDLAVLKIKAKGPFPVIPFGNSSDLMPGEPVIAIGNPFGYSQTVSDGIVSAVHRSLAESALKDVIQTNASINPGNSGGPLVNIFGRMIGINAAIRREAQNIGFAIPVDRVRESLIVSLDPARVAGLDAGFTVADDALHERILVRKVRSDSPAAKAGIRSGDVIRTVDGQAVPLGAYVNIAIIDKGAGHELRLTLERGGKSLSADVAIQVAPKRNPNDIIEGMLGADVQNLYASLAQYFEGVMISKVEKGGPAEKAGLRANDVIAEIAILESNFTATSPKELADILERLKAGEAVSLTILRPRRTNMGWTYEKGAVKVTLRGGSRAPSKGKDEI